MSRLLSTEPVRVRIGDCECPDAPHTEGDHAYLRPRLTPQAGMRLTRLIIDTGFDAQKLAPELGMAWLAEGIVAWDLLDDAGMPVPFDEATLRSGAISWEDTLLPIADRADDLYGEATLRPFVTTAGSPSSRNGHRETRALTSAVQASQRRTRKP